MHSFVYEAFFFGERMIQILYLVCLRVGDSSGLMLVDVTETIDIYLALLFIIRYMIVLWPSSI
jgi:hypothetical protein